MSCQETKVQGKEHSWMEEGNHLLILNQKMNTHLALEATELLQILDIMIAKKKDINVYQRVNSYKRQEKYRLQEE